MTDYMDRARAHVAEHARYSNAVIPPPQPYMVRWPLAASRSIFAADLDELARKVARKMRDGRQPS